MRAATKPADKKTLHELVPLDALSEARFAEIAKKITIEEVHKGRYLFRQGDRDGYSMYLLEGKINLIDGHRKVVGEIEAGTDASRYPIANQQPRPASARAVTRVVVAHIDSGLLDVFLTWDQTSSTEVTEIKADDDQDWMTRMLQSDVFSRIPPAIIQRLLMKMEPWPVHAGDVVISQGEAGDYFYTIDKGRCAVSHRSSPQAEDMRLAELSDGDFFGEAALVSDSRRNATVTMLTDGVLMRLAKKDFVELLRDQLVQTVSYDQAVEMVNRGAVWLDVRSPGEYEAGSFEDSVNIPLSDLRGEIPDLVYNMKYVICCDTARRSASAAFILSHKGFEVYVLDGGFNSLNSAVVAPAGIVMQPDTLVAKADGGAKEQNADVIRLDKHPDSGSLAISPSSAEDGREAVTEAPDPDTRPGANAQSDAPAGAGEAEHNSRPVAALQEELASLREENQRLRQELGSHQARETELSGRLAGREQLEQDLDTSHAKLASLQQQLENSSEQEQLLREQYSALQEEYTDRVEHLEQKLNQSSNLLESLQADQEAGSHERQRLEAVIDSAQHAGQARITQLEAELGQAREQMESLRTELDTANEQARQLRNNAETSGHEQQGVIAELREELQQSHRRIGTLEAEAERWREEKQAAGESANVAQAQGDEALERLQAELAQAREQAEDLQTELTAANERLERLRDDAESSVQERQQVMGELHGEVDRLKSENGAFGRQLDAERDRTAGLQQQLDELAARLEEEREHSRNTIEQLQREAETLTTDNREIVQQLESMREEQRGKLEQLAVITAENHDVNNSLQRLKEEHEAVCAEKRLLEQQHEEQQANSAQERKTAEDARDQLRLEWIAERDVLQGRVTETEQHQAALQQEVENLNARIISLIEASDETVRGLNEQLQDAQEHTSRADRQVSEQLVQIESLGQELAVSREEKIRLEVEAQTLQEKVDALQQEFRQISEGAMALEQQNEDALNKAFEDLTRKNDIEKELQGQIERLRKKLEQTGEELLEAHKEVRENTERFREELNAERRARAEERAQLAARQKELKEQLAAIGHQHEGAFADSGGEHAHAVAAAREEELTRLRQALAARDQAEEQITTLRNELARAHEETVRAVQQERERYQADLALARDQKTESDENVSRMEAQLGQLMKERDSALVEHQEMREQLNSLRAETKVARALVGSEGDIRGVDPVQLQAELEEARKNIKIAVRLRTEAEAQRDSAVRKAAELKRQYEKSVPAEGRLHVPVLDEVEGNAARTVVQAPSGKAAGVAVTATHTRRPVFRRVALWAYVGRRIWRGMMIGLAVTGVAVLIAWLVLVKENPIGPVIQQAARNLDVSALFVPDLPSDRAVSSDAGVSDAVAQTDIEQESGGADTREDSLVVAQDIPARNRPKPQARDTQDVPADSTGPEIPSVVAGRTFRDALASGGKGPVMVALPAAAYLMGSPGNSLDFDERPQHRVDLGAFSISKYEVSFAEYDRFARATGRRLPHAEGWGRGDQPVINVSWKDANAYVRWLSAQTGHKYRLPTESEWEFAARAGSGRDHWWELDTNPVPANCFECGSPWDGKRPAVVGSFPANPFGLHDTAGNVQEWTEDCYFPNYKDAPQDGSARQGRKCSQRVVRGGSYSSPVDSVRSAKRGQYAEETRLDNLGFRVVRAE